jgi:hypothetical protein
MKLLLLLLLLLHFCALLFYVCLQFHCKPPIKFSWMCTCLRVLCRRTGTNIFISFFFLLIDVLNFNCVYLFYTFFHPHSLYFILHFWTLCSALLFVDFILFHYLLFGIICFALVLSVIGLVCCCEYFNELDYCCNGLFNYANC